MSDISSPIQGQSFKSGRGGCFIKCINQHRESSKMKKQRHILQMKEQDKTSENLKERRKVIYLIKSSK